jgi:hypothetical protein
MSAQTIVIIVVVIAVIAALAVRRSGPRITQIDRTIRRDKGDRE